jgi:uncharacterized membrane protein YdjX (TVP38/TMEM64 family)
MLPVALMLLLGVALVAAFGGVGVESLREHRDVLLAWRDRHFLVALLGYAGAVTAVVALSVPGMFAMTLAAGLLFGLLPGTLIATGAATLGATLVFLAARSGPGAAARRRWGDGRSAFYARAERGLAAAPVSSLLLLRLVPVVPFVVANVAPAFFGVRTRLYVATTFLGILPGTFVTVWIGVGVDAVFDRGGAPDLGAVAAPQVLGPILGASALAALPILVRALRR